jgi:regulatory protein
LAGALARKGYPPGTAYRVVREALAADLSGSVDLADPDLAD